MKTVHAAAGEASGERNRKRRRPRSLRGSDLQRPERQEEVKEAGQRILSGKRRLLATVLVPGFEL